MKDEFLKTALIALVVVLISISYSNTFDSPFLYDGIGMLKNNPEIKNLNKAFGNLSGFNRSITYLTFAFNYYFSGMSPAGYHTFNLIFHILTSLGVGFFIYKTSLLTAKEGENARRRSKWIGFLSTFIFGLHPVHTEAVTYIYQRATVLSAAFYVFSMIAYIKFRSSRSKTKKWLFLGVLVLCAYLGMASKANTFMLPFFLVLYEFFFFKDLNWRKMGKNFLYIIPAGGLMFGFAIYVRGMNFMRTMFSRYDVRPFTLTERILTEFRVVVYYISLIFYPHPSRLKLAYNLDLSTSLISPPETLYSFLVIVFLTALAVVTAEKYRTISFGIFWFFGNLVLESTVFPLKLIFEHRLYLPSIGLILVFCVLFTETLEKLDSVKGKMNVPGKISSKAIGIIAASILILLLSISTYTRNHDWRSRISIWKDAVSKTPESVDALNAVGNAYIEKDKEERGVKYLKKALEIDPQNYRVLNNLGITYGKKGNCREAVKYFKRTVKQRPDEASPYVNLGNCYYRMGDVDKALKHYHKSLKRNPGEREAIYNMIVCYREKGEYRRAYRLAKKLLGLHPDDRKARSILRKIKNEANAPKDQTKP